MTAPNPPQNLRSARAGSQFPLSVHANGRYLVDSRGWPFLIIGDSPQPIIVSLSLSQADGFFANRKSHGFNCVQSHLINGIDFGSGDYSTYDGIYPFTNMTDISTPNESYFARVDAMINLAGAYGICVFLTVGETMDSLTLFKNNGSTKCRDFGRYVGARYKNFQNIVYCHGNDFQTWRTSGDNAVILSIHDGIRDYDTTHLTTTWMDWLISASRDSSDWESRVDIDGVYNYYPQYGLFLHEYGLSPAKPTFIVEANYEGENLRGYLTTANVLRRQQYWSMTSGGVGFFRGSPGGGFRSGWQDWLDTVAVAEVTILKNFFSSLRWWLLVPDSSHLALTGGYGTYHYVPGPVHDPAVSSDDDTNTNDYASCALASDGSILVAYLPTSRQVTIDMGKITASANALCRWFDPTTGSYTVIGTYATSGSRNFTPSSGDWVLLVEAA